MVVESNGFSGLFAGPVEEAWSPPPISRPSAISESTRNRSTPSSPVPRRCTMSCGLPASACTSSNRCGPDDGELIIYAPHIREVCIATAKQLKVWVTTAATTS
ncbi:MAG: hypothetical protein CM1200mP29_09760 [Verrucomicrobiota bacterium]|nr:MAG: hypothetical protein CM1200mP29_09760 [Verrucomicrobiota bacterium]